MKVVGITTQQEVFVASADRNFRINEWLMIEDPAQGAILGEVVEARTYNRYIPMAMDDDFVDDGVLSSLRAIGYRIDDETIYLAKLRLFEEAAYPIETGSDIRHPDFEEVRHLIIHGEKNTSLVIGEIKHTDDLAKTMDEEYHDLLTILDGGEARGQEGVPYLLDLRSMHQYPHMGIFGGSGSGKSFGLRVVLEELIQQEMPTIVLDPHYEMDFTVGGEALEDRWIAFKLGVDVGISFEDLTTSNLRQLLDTSGVLTDTMITALDALHIKGDSLQKFMDRLEDMAIVLEDHNEASIKRLIEKAESAVESQQWERRLKLLQSHGRGMYKNTVTGLIWRMNRLRNQNIFSKPHDLINEAMESRKLIVLQGNMRLLQVFTTYLLHKLYHQRREYKDSLYLGIPAPYFPPFFIVTDEAHNFAPKGIDMPAKSIFKEIAQEGRKYGVYLILATQRPTLLDETVTAQLNTKFIFRTVRASDINTIREETDLTPEEGKRLPYLKTGDVFISSAVVGRTNYVRIRCAHTESPHSENPIDELERKTGEQEQNMMSIIEDYLPIDGWNLHQVVARLEKDKQVQMTVEALERNLNDFVSKGRLVIQENPFGLIYSKA